MTRIFAVLAALVTTAMLVGCGHEAVQSASAGNNVKVDLLFQSEGVRVYRFYDAGHYHYYAVPAGGVSAATFSDWSENCGKNCTHTVSDDVPTVAR